MAICISHNMLQESMYQTKEVWCSPYHVLPTIRRATETFNFYTWSNKNYYSLMKIMPIISVSYLVDDIRYTFWCCWYFLFKAAWHSLGPYTNACINKHNITRTQTQFKFIMTVIKEIPNAKHMYKILRKNNEFLWSHQDKVF